LLKVDEEIEKVRNEFEERVLADGGTAAGLTAAWTKGAASVNRSNWRSESHFKLGAVEYLNDSEFVSALRSRRRFETAVKSSQFVGRATPGRSALWSSWRRR
jgi:hypothetical protein